MKVATKKVKGITMKKFNRYTLDLQLFGSEAEGHADGETGEAVAVAGPNGAENSDTEFERLISSRFKNEFTRKAQAIIDKRFKETKQLEEYKHRISPAIDILMKRYDVAPGDEARLADLLKNEANENASSQVEVSRRENLKSKIVTWIKDGRRLKETIPDFDLRNEIRSNKLFSQMLMSGMPVQSAYEAVHRDEILSDAVNLTAERVRKQVVDNIQAKGMRPVENGISSDSAIVTSVDVNSLTSQDIMKILKQVENGASVRF